MSKRLGLFLMMSVLLSIGALSPALGFVINMDPPSLTIVARPGDSVTRTIRLTNNGQETVSVKAYTEDWTYAPDGSKRFQAPGTGEHSAANAIVLSPQNLTIKPYEVKEVKVTVTLPREAAGGTHAVAFFETVLGEVPAGPASNNVIFAGRLGCLIYAEAEGTINRHAAIMELSASAPTATKPLEATLLFGNDGNAHIFGEGVLSILDSQGQYVGRAPINRFGVLPLTALRRKVSWAGELRPGRYRLIATLEYGGPEPAAAETELVVSGTTGGAKIKKGVNFRP